MSQFSVDSLQCMQIGFGAISEAIYQVISLIKLQDLLVKFIWNLRPDKCCDNSKWTWSMAFDEGLNDFSN